MEYPRPTLSPDEQAILDRLEYELNEDDAYLLATVDDERRGAMFTRLDALADRLRDGLDVEAASAKAAVSIPTIYRLLKSWTDPETRGLRSVAGVAGRRPRGVGRDDSRRLAVERARSLLEGDLLSDLPVKTLARLVRKATDGAISVTTAETVVREARLERSRALAGRGGAFGGQLLLDSCAVSMSELDPDDMTARLVVAATLIEVSTGLVLAAVAATEASAVQAQGAALRRGMAAIDILGLDLLRKEPTRLTATVGPAADPLYQRFVDILTRSIGAENVRAVGGRRFGRHTIDVIGRKLDRLLLLPASTEGGSVEAADARAIGGIPFPSQEVQMVLRRSVERHNEPILASLRATPPAGVVARGEVGSIREALERALPVTSADLRGELTTSNR